MMNKSKFLGLTGLLTLCGSFVVFIDKTLAEDCVQVVVPFTWTLNQTTGPGKNNVSLFQENNGPIFNTTSGTDVLNGSFTIGKSHNAPAAFCARLDALPQTVQLNLQGILDGTFANTTLGGSIQGALIETYTKTNGTIDLLPAFAEQIQGTGSGIFGITRTAIKNVGEGITPYTGTIDVSTKFGFGSGTLGDEIALFSQLRINGNLAGQTNFDIRYTVPVPWETDSLALIGSTVIFGLGLWSKQKFAQRRKDKKD